MTTTGYRFTHDAHGIINFGELFYWIIDDRGAVEFSVRLSGPTIPQER
jgi:hypothetical protein